MTTSEEVQTITKKIKVTNREEALALIAKGVKSILIFSDEAPNY
jgi:hypothetical protein